MLGLPRAPVPRPLWPVRDVPTPRQLRRSLVMVDTLGVMVAWSAALLWLKPVEATGRASMLWVVGVLVPTTLALVAAQHLYRARVCSVRSVETEKLVRTALLAALLAWVIGAHGGVTVHDAAVGAGLTFVFLRGLRSAFSSYLQAARRKGRFSRPVVLVGANEEGHGLFRLLGQHPELGFHVVGFVGQGDPGCYFDAPYLGTIDETEQAVARSGATGVIVAATALDSTRLSRLARDLTERSIHVHLSSGVRGIAQSRLRAQPLAHEPLFYVEPLHRSALGPVLKRSGDIVLAGVGLVLALPVMAVAALAVKLQDGGPILFRQPRVGRDGRHFTILKLRTMVTDAEAQYQRLAMTHAGRGGPLVKLTDDPRITPVGRFLRSSSIDELPQLFNVLSGSMSLVGPRPNLLVEAAALDEDFLARKSKVRPGITGLWQVEARDNPSFEVYRRLDLFYLENWSMRLDATILFSTVGKVAGRSVRLLVPRCLRARVGSRQAASLL